MPGRSRHSRLNIIFMDNPTEVTITIMLQRPQECRFRPKRMKETRNCSIKSVEWYALESTLSIQASQADFLSWVVYQDSMHAAGIMMTLIMAPIVILIMVPIMVPATLIIMMTAGRMAAVPAIVMTAMTITIMTAAAIRKFGAAVKP